MRQGTYGEWARGLTRARRQRRGRKKHTLDNGSVEVVCGQQLEGEVCLEGERAKGMEGEGGGYGGGACEDSVLMVGGLRGCWAQMITEAQRGGCNPGLMFSGFGCMAFFWSELNCTM